MSGLIVSLKKCCYYIHFRQVEITFALSIFQVLGNGSYFTKNIKGIHLDLKATGIMNSSLMRQKVDVVGLCSQEQLRVESFIPINVC